MSSLGLIIVIITYLILLFLIAFRAEKRKTSRWVNNPYTYTLSLAVYCTAWTYYGSIGEAATKGIDFLAIYLGPIIALPLWIVIMRKIIRISKNHGVSSIADFISLRYGKNRTLGAVITIVALLATIPYISLQLKAISDTFHLLSDKTMESSSNILFDSTFYIALILAVFATFFGTQTSDATEKHKGIVATVAIESILKLVFFLIAGIYVTFLIFDGPTDIIDQISQTPNFDNLIRFGGIENSFNWLFMIVLSFTSVFLLPRQFQISVVENTREKHLKTAIWLFPLYLFLFNIFVIYIAWGGNVFFGDSSQSEYYSLLIPLENGSTFLSLMVFLGGFSAVISMVVVSTLALSTMVSNNLIIPYGFLDRFLQAPTEKNTKRIKNIRRSSIFFIIASAYLFYISFSVQIPLISIGLIAFVIIAQLGPSFFFGMYWNRGSGKGAISGIIVGLVVTIYTMVLPFTLEAITGDNSFALEGPFGIALLKPQAMFGLDFLDPTPHAFFWSMTLNILTYFIISIVAKGNYRERNFAEIFIDSGNYTNLEDNALVWKGEAYVDDIKNVLKKFLGEARTNRAMSLFFKKYNLPEDTQTADARLINFSQKLLARSIGSASAQILINNVVKEEEISLVEVLKILEESKKNIEDNKVLTEQRGELTTLTNKLKEANLELLEKDRQKDEFLDVVAHELKTPITGIKASTEILMEDFEDMPQEIKDQFLKNILSDSERLSRLINNLLDYEKLSTGREELEISKSNIRNTVEHACQSISNIAKNENCSITIKSKEDIIWAYDEDRILQVLTNLLANAIKFANSKKGIIFVRYRLHNNNELLVSVSDNGPGVPDEDVPYIFDKFFQSNELKSINPSGNGFGLAICKQIIEKHQGNIWYEKSPQGGAKILFTIKDKHINEEKNGEEDSNS